MASWRRLWPLALVLMALASAYGLGLQRYLSVQALGRHALDLQAFVAADPIVARAAFVALYVVVVAVSLPGATMLTVASGLLFGTLQGAACAVIAATLGGTAFFMMARHAVGDWRPARAEPLMARLRKDGFSYLLAIRLTPIVPFWLANLAPALAGMRLLPFAAATLLGIIPATLVIASIGAGVGSVLQQGGSPDLAVALRPSVLLPLAGLAALALLPVLVRRWRR